MPGPIPEQVIEEVARHFDIVDLIGEYVQLKRQGRSYLGLCPFHHEKTPSFSVDPERQLFYCFGCQAGGNVFTFLQKKENLSFVEAVHHLADRAGITLAQGPESETELAELKLKQRLYDVCQAALQYFRQALKSHPDAGQARHYLVKRELEPETVERFQLGYAPAGWRDLAEYLQIKGYGVDLMEQAGLVIRQPNGNGYYDRFRNRLIFPIFDHRQRVIAFGGRVLDDGQPKYLNSPQTPIFDKGRNLYGVHLFKDSKQAIDEVIVFEGYMDLISTWQGGIANGVASLGTALTEGQARLIKRYSTNVIICYDADAAGENATQRGMELLRQAGLRVRVARVPTGKDPDEFIRHEGAEAFKTRVLAPALPLVEYRVERLKKKYDLQHAEGKAQFAREFVSILAQIDSAVETELYLRKVAAELGVTETALSNELARVQQRGRTARRNPDKSKSVRDDSTSHAAFGSEKSIAEELANGESQGQLPPHSGGRQRAEAILIAVALVDAGYGRRLLDQLTAVAFADPGHIALINDLQSKWLSGQLPPLEQLSLVIQDDTARETLPRVIAVLDILQDGHERAFIDSMEYLQAQLSKKEIPALIAEFERLTSLGDQNGALKVLHLLQKAQGQTTRQR